MPVFRVERNWGYTVMSNYHLRDKSLSLKPDGHSVKSWDLLPAEWMRDERLFDRRRRLDGEVFGGTPVRPMYLEVCRRLDRFLEDYGLRRRGGGLRGFGALRAHRASVHPHGDYQCPVLPSFEHLPHGALERTLSAAVLSDGGAQREPRRDHGHLPLSADRRYRASALRGRGALRRRVFSHSDV